MDGDAPLRELWPSEIESKQIGDGSIHAGVGRCESCAAGALRVGRASQARLSTRVTARSRVLQNLRRCRRRARQCSLTADYPPTSPRGSTRGRVRRARGTTSRVTDPPHVLLRAVRSADSV